MFNGFTDIKFDGWVQYVPDHWRPYIYLARLDRPIGVWLLLLPGLWAIMLAGGRFFETVWLIVLFSIGAVVMRAAGCVVNDLWDRDLDSKVERTKARPLASGDLSFRQGAVFLLLLLSCGLGVLLQLNGVTVVLGFACIPLILAYPLMKRFTYWPQAFLGLTFNFSALMGWSAVTEELSLAAFCLYLGGVFWTLGYDTIYAHQDKDDDALIGVRSTALKFGAASKFWVGGFYTVSALCFSAALWLESGWIGACVGYVVMMSHFSFQILQWDMNNQASCLRIFKSNRDFGLLLLVLVSVLGFL